MACMVKGTATDGQGHWHRMAEPPRALARWAPDNPRAFAPSATALPAQDEAAHNLILGIVARTAAAPPGDPPLSMALARQDGVVRVAALPTPGADRPHARLGCGGPGSSSCELCMPDSRSPRRRSRRRQPETPSLPSGRRPAASGPRALGGSAPASWTRWQRRAARGRDAPHRRGRGAGPRTVARPSPWRRPAGPVPWSAGRWPWTARPPPEHRPLPMSGRGRGAARVPGRYSGPTRTGTRVAPAHAGPGFTATATRPRSWRASAAAFWPRATAALCSPPSNQVYRLSGQRPVIDATRWRFGQSAGAGGA